MTDTTFAPPLRIPDLVPTLTNVVQPSELDPLLLLRLQTGQPSAHEVQLMTQQIMHTLRPEMEKWLESIVKRCVSETLNQTPRVRS
jgi:hypothetical protein